MAQTEVLEAIVESIEIHAPIAAVFAALTEPEQLVRWWGSDDGYRCTTMESDLRPGGAWKTGGVSRDGNPFSVLGVYRIIEPPRLIEFTWRHDWHDGEIGDETIVRYELEEVTGVTRVAVTHSGFTSRDDRSDHAAGWKTVLGWLRAYFPAERAADA